MATFHKAQVVDQGSLNKFARWAECYKVYQLPNGNDFIAIRSERDEQAMFGSQSCRGAKLIYERGKTISFDWASLLVKSRQFYGNSEEEAKAAVQSAGIPNANIRELKVTRAVQPKIAEGTDRDKDKAMAAAREHIPATAFDIQPPAIRLFSGETGVVEIQAEDETSARQQWKEVVSTGRKDISKGAVPDEFKNTIPAQKGFLGMGRKPGNWQAHWYVPFTAQISYKLPAEVTVTYVDQPINPVESNKAASVDLDGKTLVVELSLPSGESRDDALQSLKTTVLALQQGMGNGSDVVLAALLKAASPRKVLVVDNVQNVIEADDSVATLIAELPALADFDKRVICNVLEGTFWAPLKGDAFFDILCRLPADCYGRWSEHSKADRGIILLHTRYR